MTDQFGAIVNVVAVLDWIARSCPAPVPSMMITRPSVSPFTVRERVDWPIVEAEKIFALVSCGAPSLFVPGPVTRKRLVASGVVPQFAFIVKVVAVCDAT